MHTWGGAGDSAGSGILKQEGKTYRRTVVKTYTCFGLYVWRKLDAERTLKGGRRRCMMIEEIFNEK